MEPDTDLTSFLLGKISAMEAQLSQQLQAPPAAAEPAPPPPPEPTAAEKNAHFLDNLEQIAGVQPAAAAPVPETPPATLSKSSARYPRDFARYAEAIASGKTTVTD